MGTDDNMNTKRWVRTTFRQNYRQILVSAIGIAILLLILFEPKSTLSTTSNPKTHSNSEAHQVPSVIVSGTTSSQGSDNAIRTARPQHPTTTLPPTDPPPTPPPFDLFDPVDNAVLQDRKAEIKRRRVAVQEELRHSYRGYEMYAFGHDELLPTARAYKDWGHEKGGIAITMIDSLSTLWLAGMYTEFSRAVNYIQTKLSFDVDIDVSHFESTIRLVGGLISAYELSEMKYYVLLEKAKDLMDRMLPAYNTEFHIPRSVVNLKYGNSTGLPWQSYASPLAEYGTVHLELRALTYHTKDPKYGKAAQRINSFLMQHCPGNGLCPTLLHPDEGHFVGDLITLGGLGDSYYEYLLKQWVHTGKQDTPTLHRFLRAASSIIQYLVVNQSGYVYVTQKKAEFLVHRMDHLACFLPGMFLLGVRTVPWGGNEFFDAVVRMELPGNLREKFLHTAEGLLETCWRMYNNTRTKLGAETVIFNEEGIDDGNPEYMRVWRGHQPYLLRPEVLESMYYMWVHTGEEKWRDYAWQMFRAIKHYCRLPHGYGGVVDVMTLPPESDDLMQSFWIAETLKYLYLIFTDERKTQEDFLAEWVLNTEAHPLKIRKDYFDIFPLEI